MQRYGSFLVLSFVFSSRALALDIALDYRHDNFIQSHPEAKAAVEAAASELSDLITTRLSPITINTDPTFGAWLDAEASLDWFMGYQDPTTLQNVVLEQVDVTADEVRIFVGGADYAGGVLAFGGPASIGVQAFANGSSDDWTRAVQVLDAIANDAMSRGGGPVLTTIRDSPIFGGEVGTYAIDVGLTYGTLSFDTDRNNDGLTDTTAELEAAWHFDHTTPVAEGKYDFYSVVIHEMTHALGFGNSATWESQVSGSQWMGPNVLSILGDGSDAVDKPGHIMDSLMSTRVTDGTPQEAMMSPSLARGVRSGTTLIDLAFFRDLGFETSISQGSLGDFDNNGTLSVEDLDQIVSAIAAGAEDLRFDVVGNGTLDLLDIAIMLSRIADQNGRSKPYLNGDLNLDGAVDAQDLNRLGLFWGQDVTGWSNGDIVPDGIIDAQDLNVLGRKWGRSSQAFAGTSVATVPEPAAGLSMLLAVVLIASRRRRQ